MAIIAKIISGQNSGYSLGDIHVENTKKEACAKASIAL